ncbi:MAG TPA: hypothetical protein V6D08_18995 [Candidatus Obscuribacterales bacterium]
MALFTAFTVGGGAAMAHHEVATGLGPRLSGGLKGLPGNLGGTGRTVRPPCAGAGRPVAPEAQRKAKGKDLHKALILGGAEAFPM